MLLLQIDRFVDLDFEKRKRKKSRIIGYEI